MTNLKQGNEAFRRRDYKKAVELYDQVIEQAPNLKSIVAFNRKQAQVKLLNNNILQVDSRKILDKLDCYVSDIEYYSKDHPAANFLMNYQVYTIDIVVPVYNALEDVKKCLDAIHQNTDGFRVTTYIINDASEPETTKYLRDFCKDQANFVLIEHEVNKMYTKTVNDGLRASTADYVITLNSDTIVTRGWLQGLVRCMRSDQKIGVVGPLSNAASWQNVPILLDEDKQFAVNDIPNNMTPNEMAEYVNQVSYHVYPRVPFVNGFCFMISRQTIDKVGYLDEETFPTGYGEENDYCLRVAEAGFSLAIADDTYVFHAKSKSFGHEKRKEYSKNGSAALKAKHGKEKVNALGGLIREMTVFDDIRRRVQEGLVEPTSKKQKDPFGQRILFLLPVSGGGGGVHSIVQEVMGMRRLGVNAKIAVPTKHRHKFLKVYEDIAERESLFEGFDVAKIQELINLSKKFDVIIGTIYTSMKMVKEVKAVNKSITTAYYVQDYEPLFSEQGTQAWQEAFDSYTLVPGTILFAKTDWIGDKVFDAHGVKVQKVSPSIDHDVYKPKAGNFFKEKIVISAMIRPKTPRRGADRTMRLLKKVHDTYGEKVKIELFGCEGKDPLFQQLENDFKYTLQGVLTRNGVAEVLQESDIFIDLSDYQAFGRTGLENMACGSLSVVTKYGGVYEYIKDKENGLIVDVFDENSTFEKIRDLIESQDLYKYKLNSLMQSQQFSINKSAISELLIF